MSDEMDELRRKRLEELQNQSAREQDAQRQKEQTESVKQQKQSILRSILSDQAKQRVNNIKLVNPQMAEAIENQLITLAQSGRIRGVISEEQLLQMLRELQNSKRDTKIKFKRV
ncbi:MAG: DNA-binding protein [Deltaproteobacteria bacterium]|nr:DNA-binding protein [Deltaproteobacteria bacterium]